MTQVQILPPAAKFLKKLKDKKLTNYELAYRVRQLDDLIIIIIMAGTRENFYEELKRYIRTI